ncbi:MAG TPA: GDYXXLXY domain-containing protein [Chthoniobacterales bacterium]|nr:GDYXXLXY domain-containing protein [Chthoniobacterales bacterium]
MKFWRLTLFALVGLAQLAVPASLVWKREQTMRHGSVWKFRTAPVDPVDAFRGRYVALEFEAEGQTISPPANFRFDQTVFVTLRQNPEGFAEIDQVLLTRPMVDDFIEAQLRGKTVSLPFDRYWVTERDAPAADAAYRAQSRRDKRNAFATVRVFRGDAGLEQLYLDGLPLGEYLRANAGPK